MSGSTSEATPTPARLTIYWAKAGLNDVAGTLVVGGEDGEGEGLWQHMSSSVGWLERDLLHNFGRDQKLAELFPQGYEVTCFRLRKADLQALYRDCDAALNDERKATRS